MCDFQTLAFNENGYVVRCSDCGHYQLGFGTTMLTLTNDGFTSLLKMVTRRLHHAVETEAGYFSEETKNIYIATSPSCCCLILNKKELHRLHEILDRADDEIKTLSLLELFEKNDSAD